MSQYPVIFYQYSTSPFAHKINNTLLVKGIPHAKVTVSPILPRPELSSELGIAYRRIPLLAIGRDVYCDTNLITSVLERRFPESVSIFPARADGGKPDTGMIKVLSNVYGAKVFPLAVGLLDWDKFPAPFLKDRSELMGGPINPKAMVARRPLVISTLASHLVLLEEQLSDGRSWLFDTVSPSLADLSIHFAFAWIMSMPASKALDWAKYPKTTQWVASLNTILKSKKSEHSASISKISGTDAAKLILASDVESLDVVGFDAEDAARLGLKSGDVVAIAPEDTGKSSPTVGKLVALNSEEIVIETSPSAGSVVRCHFPRLGFTVRRNVQQSKL